ncbi:MAG TPA: serine protease [Caulobacteraceae bacterium]|nr:serine protease [Caulobacteraceae bacterium]
MRRLRAVWVAAGLGLAFALAGVSAVQAQGGPDPIARAERSVVRIVTLSFDASGQLTGVSLGSGFAVAPGEVVTNHHVIAGAAGAAQVQVFVIPERDSGGRPTQAQVAKDWPAPDLALLSAPGLAAPALTVALAIPAKDAAVYALGYPGVTDAMRKLPVEKMLSPEEPYVTSGSVALVSATAPGGDRFQTIFHTAAINEGNSGGPLIDPCGRVIGVNAQIGGFDNGAGGFTSAEGQSTAVSASVLADVLGPQGLRPTGAPCVAPIEAALSARLAADEAAIAAEAQARVQAQAQLTAEARARRHDLRLFAIIIGALVVLAAGLVIVLRGPRPARADARPSGRAWWATLVAVVALAAATAAIALVLLARRAPPMAQPAPAPASAAPAAPGG